MKLQPAAEGPCLCPGEGKGQESLLDCNSVQWPGMLHLEGYTVLLVTRA